MEIKIDGLDRKILYELDFDARQSYSKIGKKVGLHRNYVLYRINKLIEEGVIKNFYAVIDCSKIGYNYLRFYINYQYVTPEIKRELINDLVTSEFATFVHSAEGQYDLVLVMAVKNMSKFYNFWEKLLEKYRDHIHSQIFSMFIEDEIYRYSFLLDKQRKNNEDANGRVKTEVFNGNGKKIDIDEIDYEILKLLAENARTPTSEIARRIGTSSHKIKNRIKTLVNCKIIRGFRVNLDFSKLGYQYHNVQIMLKDYSKRRQIVSYIKENPFLGDIIKSIGLADLQFELFLKDRIQLHQILEDLSEKFPNSIKNYSYFCITNSHKWNFLPSTV